MEEERTLAPFEKWPLCPGCGRHDAQKRPMMVQTMTHNHAQMTLWQRLKTWWHKPICRDVKKPHIHRLCCWCGYEWLTELYEDSIPTMVPLSPPGQTPMPLPPEPSLMILPPDESEGRVTIYGFNGSERKVKQPGGGAGWNEQLGEWEGARGRKLAPPDVMGGGDRVVDSGPGGTMVGYKAGGGDTVYPFPPPGYRIPMADMIAPELPTNEKVQKGVRK